MTRLFTDGAEMGDMNFWNTNSSGTTVQSSTKRSGSYAYEQGSATGNLTRNIVDSSDIYTRAAMRWKNYGANTKVLTWHNSGTELGSVRSSANNFLTIYVGTTLVATANKNALTTNVWYLIEIHIKIADDGGKIEVRVDGVDTVSYTGDTKPGAATTVNVLNYNGAGSSGNAYLDDLACNDTSGGADNSWCGDGRVILLNPNANGDSSEWVGSDGNSTDNYQLVDDIPPSEADYVEASDSGKIDLYNLTDCGLSNVNIRRVWPEARAADTVAEGGKIYLPIKIGGTVYDGTEVELLTTYTKQLLGDVRTVNPATSSAWTTSNLDSLQVGAKVK